MRHRMALCLLTPVVLLLSAILFVGRSPPHAEDNGDQILSFEQDAKVEAVKDVTSHHIIVMTPQATSHSLRPLVSQCSSSTLHLQRNQSIRRFLTTSKIHRKYGLTNILMIVSSMFAYGGRDNRAIVFPAKCPVHLEDDLIDVRQTEMCLAGVNVAIEAKTKVDALGLKQISAWRLGMDLGNRKLAGATNAQNASAALSRLTRNMQGTSHIPIVSYGDFFLRFPFYAQRPIDLCFYMRQIAFQPRIVDASERILHHMRQRGVTRLMTVHLRLEDDIVLVDKRFTRVSPLEVARFWREEIVPAARRHAIDGVYVCAGKLDGEYWEALYAESAGKPFHVYTKADILATANSTDEIVETTRKMSAEELKKKQTTSHVEAAVDLLIASQATLAVSTQRSTFLLAILSRRCPSPSSDVAAYIANSSLYQLQQKGGLLSTTTTAYSPRFLGINDETVSRREAYFGVYGYSISSMASSMLMGKLVHVRCDQPFEGHCFY